MVFWRNIKDIKKKCSLDKEIMIILWIIESSDINWGDMDLNSDNLTK